MNERAFPGTSDERTVEDVDRHIKDANAELPPLLTDERIVEVRKAQVGRYGRVDPTKPYSDSIQFARAIESEVRTAIAAAGGGVPPAVAQVPQYNEEGWLPCPFCGSNEVSKSQGSKGDGSPWFYVECENCAACGEVDGWNKRAAPEAPAKAAPSAGEVERGDVVAFEFYNRATGHAIVDYSVNTHVGNLSAAKGYEARPLVYAAPRQNVLDGSKPIPAWQAREALDELEAAARGDAPFNHQAAAVVRAALSHKEQP